MEKDVIFNSAITIIDGALNKKPISDDFKKQLDGELLKKIYKLLKFHGFNHVLFNFSKENDFELFSPLKEIVESDYFTALSKSENTSFESGQIIEALSNGKIKHVILKGEELKSLYPKGFIRQSADIDVLVEEENLEKALKILNENFKIVSQERNFHDVTLITASNVVIELHFTLSENDEKLDLITNDWKDNLVKGKNAYNYKLNTEFLICYLVAHTAYHFYNGGAGIKAVIDLYLIKNLPFNKEIVLNRLKVGGLDIFYEKLNDLVLVWFDGNTHTDLTLKMQEFILSGGEYGNYYQSKKAVNNKNVNNIVKKIFLPYSTLCNYYPSLKKCPLLYPVFIVHRFIKALFSKEKLDRAKKQIKAEELPVDKKENINNLFKELNL